jgi:hypothetical protein
MLQKQQEIDNKVECLQRALAGLREQVEDFRAEQSEDLVEVRYRLQELGRNKVWMPKERF